MKKYILTSLLLLFSGSVFADTSSGSDAGSSVSKSGYRLVFSTESPATYSNYFANATQAELANCTASFSSQSQLEEHWLYAEPEKAAWNMRMGQTLEEKRQNLVYDNETLKLYAKKVNSAADGTEKFLTSGIKSKEAYTYGIFEFKAKCLAHTGNFPALWMMPEKHKTQSNWPFDGEIDVMEMINSTYTVYGTIHNAICQCVSGQTGYFSGITLADKNYHIYTLKWTTNEIIWYKDGTQFYKYSKKTSLTGDDLYNQYPFDQPFYLIVNQSCGNGGWAANPDEDFSYEMDVAYVRVYQEIEPVDPNPVTEDDDLISPNKVYHLYHTQNNTPYYFHMNADATNATLTTDRNNATRVRFAKGSTAGTWKILDADDDGYYLTPEKWSTNVTQTAYDWTVDADEDGLITLWQDNSQYYGYMGVDISDGFKDGVYTWCDKPSMIGGTRGGYSSNASVTLQFKLQPITIGWLSQTIDNYTSGSATETKLNLTISDVLEE